MLGPKLAATAVALRRQTSSSGRFSRETWLRCRYRNGFAPCDHCRMLLTISTTASPATDLGYLLFKNPARVHRFELSFGHATVFYPEASADRCTVCLLLDIDPVAMVRRKSGPAGDGGVFAQYVNDRPYVASSFLSVAISESSAPR